MQLNLRNYDREDINSILLYASRLTGHSLSEFGEMNIDQKEPKKTKGFFGQDLETVYFGITNNNSPLPDFPEAGLELKSTPMKKISKGLVPKERLILNIINYREIEKDSWQKAFMKKDADLLIVFYQYEKDVPYYDLKIIKVVHWKLEGNDLRMIKEDWDIIEKYILEGRAEELSERHTKYLAACRKGAGGDADLREQPFSDMPAPQRALSFKPTYVAKIFAESEDLADELAKRKNVRERTGYQSLFDGGWDDQLTFEEAVLRKIDRFVGRTCAEIESMTGMPVNDVSKQYYATLAAHMMGVTKKHVKEFVDADICMKTVRLNTKGRSKESMSFPYFRYDEVVRQSWEQSDLCDQIDKKFFFPVFRMTDKENKDKRKAVFLGAFFWSMPYADIQEARKVWNITQGLIGSGDYDHFPGSKDNRVAHVRPHGRDSKDLLMGADGKMHIKYGFWLNADYITSVVRENLKLDRGLEITHAKRRTEVVCNVFRCKQSQLFLSESHAFLTNAFFEFIIVIF